MPDLPGRATVISDLEKLGYRVEVAESPEEGMNKMQFVNYAAVILHSRFEGNDLESGSFHRFLRWLNMSTTAVYLLCPDRQEFKTLYDLQALACSANLVVNDNGYPAFFAAAAEDDSRV